MEIGYFQQHQHLDNGEALLPPGFRFHPTDEELITYYLLKKVLDSSFNGRAIAEVDLNKCEPWELPEKAKMGEKEWYFFSLRDRKYPTGLRTNRATEAGYWKATGKDREIYSSKTGALIGMKKTLVFYRGRAPKGEKSNWVMHEYRLEGKFAYHYLSRSSKDEWVISRVFQKTGAGAATSGNNACKKTRCNTSMLLYPDVSSPSSVSQLPPLLEPTITNTATTTTSGTALSGNALNDRDSYSYDNHHNQPEHVSCFSTIAAAAASAAAAGGTYQSNCFELALPQPPLPSLATSDPCYRFPRSVGVSGFPSLRSLQENFQLPLFFSSPATAALVPPFPSGGSGIGTSWLVGSEDSGTGNVGGGGGRLALGPTELDCMWS